MKTTNYNLFKFAKQNRVLVPAKVKSIEDSINKIGFVSSKSILVNPEFLIIDGQHRFQACVNLGLPIYYEVTDIDMSIAMKELNKSQNSWLLKDYINLHASDGILGYAELKHFMETSGVSSTAALVMATNPNFIDSVKSSTIRKGKPININPKRFYILSKLQEVKKIIGFADTKAFIVALSRACNCLHEKQINKILNAIPSIKQQANYTDYIQLFENILNKWNKGGDKIKI
jgi:hypothetical protein